LVKIRKLFDEEDRHTGAHRREENENKFEKAAYNLSTYDLEGHKTMYAEAIETRKR
jgi:hypothetical protein